jgi:cobalt-zinc-cadmium efflux system protein
MGMTDAHGHAGARHRWRLAAAFGLVASFFVVELVAGLLSGSLALISDAGHMAADVVALGAALAATLVAARPDTSGRRSFGFYRVEIFASGLTVLIMLAVALFVVVEAIGRIREPVEVVGGVMLVVGVLGLLVNVVSLLLLRGGAGESLNVKGAYLEVLADSLGSIGVFVAAVLVGVTGEGWWDTAVALALGAFVAVRAVLLGREVLAVLAQDVPATLDATEVATDLRDIDGVIDVHDLHLWTLTSGMHVATAHLVCRDGADPATVLAEASTVLRERWSIDHATLQVEPRGSRSCVETSW